MDKFFLIIVILLRIFSNPIANVFQKKLSTNNSSFTINMYCYLILSILCLFKIESIVTYQYSIEFVILVITCGILCTLGMLCMIKAINIGELSVLGPINSYKSVIALVIAIFLLNEIPTFWEIMGIILIIWGSKYVLSNPNEKFSLEVLKRKDIKLRFTALTLTAIEAVLLKEIILISSVEICFIFWCFMGFIWSLILLLTFKKSIKVSQNKDFIAILIVAIGLGIMQYSTNYVFEKMDVGLALALFQLSAIVTVLFGYKIFHETNLKYKLIGSSIMIIGAILIIIF